MSMQCYLQEAAFGLIGALCKGCPENLNFVVTSTKDLFYSESSPVTSWEFPPTVLPRNLKGISVANIQWIYVQYTYKEYKIVYTVNITVDIQWMYMLY